MPKPSPVTKAFDRAHTSLLRSFDMALDKMGRVPFGEEIVDPRTLAARKALYAGMIPSLPMNSDYIRPKERKLGNHPMPPNATSKHMAAGKVVDPTAIETAQGADSVDVDTASSAGMSNTSLLEGP